MKFSLKRSLTALALATMLFGGSSLFAQNLINSSSGTIHIYSNAAVVFTENAGEFENDAVIGNIVNDGRIVFQGTTNTFTGTNPLGADDVNRVPGTVEYNGDANAQAVQTNRYFTNLIINNINGGSVVFPAAANTWLSGTYTLTSGTRTYTNNTFYFDGGDGLGGEDQNLNFTESFNNLVFSQDGKKTITNAGAITVNGTFDIAATATDATDILGSLTLVGVATVDALAGAFNIGVDTDGGTVTIGTGDATFNNTAGVNLVEGLLDVSDDGDLIIATGVTLDLAAADGVLRVGDGSRLQITGALTNQVALGLRTNFEFHCNSTEVYDATGAQTIAAVDNVTNYKYGNLEVRNSTKTLENNIYLCNTLALTSADINAYNGGADYDVVMTTASAITFTNLDDEIQGVVRREHAFAMATPYTYNNEGTIVTFTDITNTGGFFEVSSVPSLNPHNYDQDKGITRRILLDYDGTSMQWTTSIGFYNSDIPGTNGYPVTTARFYEGDVGGTGVEKMATNNPYSRTTGTAPEFLNIVSLPGFINTLDVFSLTADAGFQATNEIVVTFGPSVFTSIDHGRWSNPDTWDEGIQPGPDDEALIRHTVHIGYKRLIDNDYGPTTAMSGQDAGDNSEGHFLTNYPGYNYVAGNTMELISKITIDDLPGASLLVGEGTDGAVTFAIRDGVTGSTNSGYLFNNNSGNGTELALTGTNIGAGTSDPYDGFYILNQTTQLNALQVENSGFIGLVGPLRIGN